MRTRLILVRHGESIHSVEGFVGGPNACQGLTPRGHEQAAALGDRLAVELADDGPVAVYSSMLPRAVETAAPVAAALGATSIQDCGLCSWHVPPYADGLPTPQFLADHAIAGGGVLRPFQEGNESWAELVLRVSRAIVDIAHRHRGSTVVLVGHSETVNGSFHALAAQPLYRAFDITVAPASVTEWTTQDDPAQWPQARWTLHRFNDAR